MNSKQLKEMIRDVLHYLDPEIPYSEMAVELLMLTAAVESNLGEYFWQVGGGTARGIFQIEKRTEGDMWANFIRWKNFLGKMQALRVDDAELNGLPDMKFNLAYQIAMARVYYYRQPFKLPATFDVAELAEIWKRYYNTDTGEGTVAKAIAAYHKFV